METATEPSTKTRTPRGRKDRGQEAAIKLDPIKESVEELVQLHRKAAEAGDAYSDGVKKVAEKSGLLASVVRKFVSARAGEKFKDEKTKAEQLNLLFEDVGE